MTDESLNPPAACPTGAGAPSTVEHAALDANGFDPNELEWRPVPRRPRRDGWTPEVQGRFIDALARLGIVERACEEVGMSTQSAYALRNAPGSEGFARAWAEVLTRAADRLLDVAFAQAIEGEEVPIFGQDGVRTGARYRYNTRMAMFLLRTYHPDRFRHAHKDVRAADEVRPAAALPVPDVLASLGPVKPAAPHLLSTPDRLDDMVYGARALAEYDRAFQPSDHQPYRRKPVPANHPAVTERSRRRRARRRAQEEREDARFGRE